MNDKNVPIAEFNLKLIADFFHRLPMQGPGDDSQTLKALSFMEGLPFDARIADIGCGTGRQTAVLARALGGMITAVDLLPEMTAGLTERMVREGLTGKVRSLTASMDALPFQDEEFDAIWAEGSIYNIGYERGISEWHRFLKPGGYIAVTECSWLTARRPDDSPYIYDNFPDIASVSRNIRVMEEAGYIPTAHFILPEYCWTDNYYQPMDQRIKEFLSEYDNSEDALKFARMMKEDMEHYLKYKSYYGYVFYIGRRI